MDAKQVVKTELAKKRASAIAKAEENKIKAITNPEYKELDKQERELILKISKQIAENKKPTELEAKLKDIKTKKENVLNSLGLSSNDLVPHFSCKLCNDTGFVNNAFCHCYSEKLTRIISQTNEQQFTPLSKLEISKNAKQAENLEKIKQILKIFVKSPKNYVNILFCGKTGVGKTTLAEGVLGEAQQEQKLCLKVSSFQINELFTKYHTTFTAEREDYLKSLLNCDYLLIDDLGTEPIKNNITLEYLYLVLSERENNGHFTIITTNLDPERILARYGERIFSRISSKKTTLKFYIDGDDLRLL